VKNKKDCLPSESEACPLHMVDLILKKRDGGALDAREIGFIVAGAARESIPLEQLSAWLMASWLNGLTLEETRALAVAMRDSGEKFDTSRLGKVAVDKHSTGGVGDKTSFLVAPMVAACGLAVPMISGRALGHTGGTLDKLEAIPGFRTALSLEEFEKVLEKCGTSIISQTPTVVPADRVLFRRLAGGGEVLHQLVQDIVVARLLEVGQDDFLGIGLGVGAALAHQAGGPQAEQLVLARGRLELQVLVVLELLLEGFFALVERGHGRSGWARCAGI